MSPSLLLAFQNQILLQCRFLLFASQELERGIAQSDHTLIFYSIQNLLGAAANISKVLWGTQGKKPSEKHRMQARKPLRDSLGVSDSSPMRSVTMRNNYEHFDERLEEWERLSRRHNSIDLSLLSGNAIAGMENRDLFRNYDPVAMTLMFWGEKYDIKALVNEASRLLPKIEEELMKSYFLRKPIP
jgi:hypothetical protein